MSGTDERRGSADANFRAICELGSAAMEHLRVPGVAIGVIAGEAELLAGLGVTNVNHPLPVDADTLFQIGSTTKTVTATAAMRLAEQGRLDLDAPVRAYLPALRLADEDVARRVTVRQLFSHTAGWLGDYFDDTGNGDDALAAMVDRMATLPQIAPLGAVWSYNNAAFYLAGRVIELLAGTSYEQAATELVLAPLGMDRSFFFAHEAIIHRVAVGHGPIYEGDGAPPVLTPWPIARSGNPAGGIVSTARDQLRYARFHMGDGRAASGQRLLSPEGLAAMQNPAVAAANGEHTGLAWFLRDTAVGRIVRHGGATKGQESAFLMVPERQFAVTVLTNSDRGSELADQVVRDALRRFLGLEERPPEPVAADPARLVECAGRYTARLDDCVLALRGDELWLEVVPHGGFPTPDTPAQPAPPPMRAALTGDDRLVVLDPPGEGARGEFLRGPGGAIAWLRIGGRIHRRAEG